MTRWLMRAEAVNFDATLDTNDLSTIRGGSLGLLRLGEEVKEALKAKGVLNPTLCFSGASQCAFAFELNASDVDVAVSVRDAVAKRLRCLTGAPNTPPLAQMTVVVDVAPLKGLDRASVTQALQQAEARNHGQQFRRWTIPPLRFDVTAERADPFDLVRPAVEKMLFPPGKVLNPEDSDSDEADSPGAETGRVAITVARRRAYGRRQRQRFYGDRGQLDGIGIEDRADEILRHPQGRVSFANSFQDIVDRGEPNAGPLWALTPSLENKIAVVYADGNGFGKIRERVGVAEFAQAIEPLRKRLLAAVLRWYMSGVHHHQVQDVFAVNDSGRLGLRFETLLWGGDELMFVMPAWLAFAFVEAFFATTGDWKVGGSELTHAVGVVIAHCKAPIRQLKRIAVEAADGAKEAGLRDVSSVTFEVFESVAPPDTGLAALHRSMYGGLNDSELALELAIPGAEFGEFVSRMRKLIGTDGKDGFPRSQLYGALRAVRESGGTLADAAGVAAVRDSLAAYRRRAGGDAMVDLLEDNLPPDWDAAVGHDEKPPRPLSVALVLIAQLWDYAAPFEQKLPAWPALEAVAR